MMRITPQFALFTREKPIPSSKLFSLVPWILLGLAIILLPFPQPAGAASEHTFRLEASRFEYSPAILMVSPGDRITIELVATDVVHGLSIDGYDLEIMADPGKTERLTFTADRQGVFRFRCTVTCGNLHPFMIGKLYVGASQLFWRLAGLALLSVLAVIWKAGFR